MQQEVHTSSLLSKVPAGVHILAVGIFAMVMSEFATAGLMPQLSKGLQVSTAEIGYLVTVFAVSMAVGGPVLVFILRKTDPKTSLILILVIFLMGNVVAVFAANFAMMVLARVVTGAAAQAFLGSALSLCVALVPEHMRGRAIGVAMNGLMLGTLLGLPVATYIGGQLGWRYAFVAITAVAAGAGLLFVFFGTAVGYQQPEARTDSSQPLTVLKQPQLILALLSSTLIIGSTFSAFNFFAPILTEIASVELEAVPLLLLAHGAASLLGNWIVSRLADKHTVLVLLAGTSLNGMLLLGFTLWTSTQPAAVFFMIAIGITGITLNPAMTIRIHRAAGNASPLINTIHSSFISLGIIISSAAGSALVSRFGLHSTLILGITLAVLAITAILPALSSPYIRTGQKPAPLAEASG
ncbi:MFS transporter [Paenarthrobacter sp. NPDC090517]|uniref:MFS transporter n=1 Tax=Paenarthrobacter sp. NPDC090517 TaxID=3364381 RepID=UPI003825B6B4